MKKLIASVFALSLLGATAASADSVGVGLHVGNVGIHVGSHHHWHHRYWHHHHWYAHQHCWWHDHHRVCRWY